MPRIIGAVLTRRQHFFSLHDRVPMPEKGKSKREEENANDWKYSPPLVIAECLSDRERERVGRRKTLNKHANDHSTFEMGIASSPGDRERGFAGK